MEHSKGGPIFLLTCMATLQLLLGGGALIWAWPLFADPPFLRTSLVRELSQLRSINAENGVAIDLLSAQREKLNFLFEHYSEGTAVALIAGACLVFCGILSIVIALWLRRTVRPGTSARA